MNAEKFYDINHTASKSKIIEGKEYVEFSEAIRLMKEYALQEKKKVFYKALELLRSLADLQNDAPLERWRKEWKEVMDEVWAFLKKHEKG